MTKPHPGNPRAAAPTAHWLASRAAAVVGVLAVVVFTYRSVLTGVYGYSDDYLNLYNIRLGRFDPAHSDQAGMGRPLTAFVLYTLLSACDSVERLAALRLLSLLCVAAVTLVLAWTMLRHGFGPGFALTVGLLFAFSPAAGIYAAWAETVVLPCAILLSLWAGCLIEKALRQNTTFSPARLTLALGLLLAACTLWQAAAPFAVFAAFVAAWPRVGAEQHAVRRVWLALGVYVVAAALYLALFLLAVRFGFLPRAGSDRVVLATDVVEKMKFLAGLLRAALTSWGRLQPGWREVAVGSLAGLGCLAAVVAVERRRVDWRVTGRRLALVGAVVLAGVSPLLAARENTAACRTLALLYTLVAFLTVAGYGRLLVRAHRRVRAGAALALLGAAAAAADYHVRWGIVEPNQWEYVGLRRQVLAQFSEPPRRLVYLLPPTTLLARPKLTCYWEYGQLSSSFWWVTKPFLFLLFQEIPRPRIAPADAPPAAAAAAASRQQAEADAGFELYFLESTHPDLPVLRPLPVLLRAPGERVQDKLWGEVVRFPHGWLYVPWLGYLDTADFPVVQHHLLGPLISLGTGPDNLWFFREKLGVFHTGAPTYPKMYLQDRKAWFQVSDEPGRRLYLDALAGSQRLPLGEEAPPR